MNSSQIIDLTVVFIYIFGITLFGLWVGRKASKNEESYFLGGRSFSWVLIGFSLFATNISIGFFVGWTGKAARAGFAAFNPELLGGFMLTISAIFFIPLYIRARIFTIPQFLGMRFNDLAKLLYGGLFISKNILASPLGMFTGGLAILTLFNMEVTPVNLWICGAGIACTVGLYAVFGGLTSVVITDLVQVILMITGALLIAGIGLYKVGGIGELYAAMPDHFELLRPATDKEFPWNAAIPGQALHSAFYAFAEIAILQRALGARSLHDARCGLLLGGFLKLFGIAFFVIPGMVGVLLYPDLPNADQLYTTMVRDFLPVGLSGLVLAGMLAAMMSSQDSGINAMSSVVAMDFWPHIRKNAREGEGVLVGKGIAAFNILWGVAACPLFLLLDRGIFDMIMTIAGFMVLPVGVCFLFGRFNKRVNSAGAVTTLGIGLVLGVYYTVCSSNPVLREFLPTFMREWHFYHVYPVLVVFLSAILFIVSYLTPKPTEAQLACVLPMSKEVKNDEPKEFYKTFNFWWIVYLCIFCGMYIIL
jgi:SSS family solute:Na+ symporter